MSVICKVDNKIILYCKGADTVIKERLEAKSQELFLKTEDHLNVRKHLTENELPFNFFFL